MKKEFDIDGFLQEFDREGTVVLLEGKRKVLPEDTATLIELGRLLASRSRNLIFRSGNAPGADELFIEGVKSVDPARVQLIVPYSGHRKKESQNLAVYSLDEMNLAAEPEVLYQTKLHTGLARHVDRYVAGEVDARTMKVAYIMRDTVKVLGAVGLAPASFAFFYDDLSNPRQGGTGHTMKICDLNGVPWVDQRGWNNSSCK